MNPHIEIYCGQCEHLYCNDIRDRACKKRRYVVLDIFNKREVHLFFCNDYLKIKVQEKITTWEKEHPDYDGWNYTRHIGDVVEKYIFQNIPKYGQIMGAGTGKHNPTTHFDICQRPWIWINIPLLTLMKVYIDVGNSGYWGTRFVNLKETITRELYMVINNISPFIKYRSDKKELERLIRKINNTYNKEIEDLAINETYNKIFDILIKYEKNGTSKQRKSEHEKDF